MAGAGVEPGVHEEARGAPGLRGSVGREEGRDGRTCSGERRLVCARLLGEMGSSRPSQYAIHRGLVSRFRYALVWGSSSKFKCVSPCFRRDVARAV